MSDVKKRKMDDAYENLSREELVSRIRELENDVETLRNVKSHSDKAPDANDSGEKRPIDFSKYRKRHIALKLLYLGWNYNGYVVQDNTDNTIEDHLFKALIKGRLVEDRATSKYNRCGRTDLGVSAFCQVISVTVRSRLNNETSEAEELPYCKILNSLLPYDIRALAWSPVSDSFSARFSCKSRTYKYWFPRGDLNVETMDRAAKQMIGIHDFRNFCKMDVKNGVTNFTRQIFNAQVSLFRKNSAPSESVYDMYHLIITAKGFLWHQIRCIVSILFLIGQGKEDIEIVQKLFDVEKYPQKPQYALSSPLPLNLYSCEFDGVDWRFDQESTLKVTRTLQSRWTSEAIKTCMLENMLQDWSQHSTVLPTDLIYSLSKDNNPRKHKPLFSRPVSKSLGDRVSFFVKKGRLRPKIETENKTGE